MVKKNLKRMIALALALTMAVLPVYGSEIQNTQADTSVEAAQGFEPVVQNEAMTLYLNTSTMGIMVGDHQSGNVYASFAPSAEGLNDSWQSFMYSGVTVEYMSPDMKLTRLPFKDNATADINYTDSGFEADITYDAGFALKLIVSMENGRLTVNVPDDSIVEPEDGNRLQNLYIFPFLGATYGSDVPGYLFIPDGCGALIRTDQVSVAASGAYSKRIYGQEMGVGDFAVLTERSMLNAAEQIYMPVYGIIQEEGQSGITAIIEDGDAYAAIEANVCGRELPANYVTARFIYRETYTRSLNQSGDTMVANQSERNHMDIIQHFYFLSPEAADYSGMAGVYQDYLVETGILERSAAEDERIPMRLELLMSEQEEQMVGSKTIEMTTMEQADDIINTLCEGGVNPITAVMFGYSPDGAGSASPSSASFTRDIASKSQWKETAEKWAGQGVSLGYWADFSVGCTGVGGYSKQKDVAQNINQKLLETFRGESVYYLAPTFVLEQFNEEAGKYKEAGASVLALDTVGYQLYSNWNEKQPSTRQEAMDIYAGLSSEDMELAVYRASQYMWPNASAIYEMPSDSSNYMVFTDTVPFMQMVLKGYIDYYGTRSNFHADRQKDLLKAIEYGEFPSWMITGEDSIELLDTATSWLYTSQFSIWEEEMISEYHTLSDALGSVRNAAMVRHDMLTDNVVRVTYDNGVTITVNYSDEPFTDGSVTVDALSYAVGNVQ